MRPTHTYLLENGGPFNFLRERGKVGTFLRMTKVSPLSFCEPKLICGAAVALVSPELSGYTIVRIFDPPHSQMKRDVKIAF